MNYRLVIEYKLGKTQERTYTSLGHANNAAGQVLLDSNVVEVTVQKIEPERKVKVGWVSPVMGAIESDHFSSWTEALEFLAEESLHQDDETSVTIQWVDA
jgi:hypothetical protein